MLAVGAEKIKGLCVGEQNIKAAYLGGEQVFSGEEPPRLPEGYTRLQYIQSGNGQYFSTGVTATNIYRLEMDVEPVGTKSGTLFGASFYVGGKTVQFSAKKYATSVDFYSANSGNTATIKQNIGNKRVLIVFDRNNRTFSVDGETATYSSYIKTSYTVYALYGYDYNNKGTFTPLAAKLYSLRLYNSSGELIRDFVPCKNPSGVVGVYSIPNEVFYKSLSGTFTAGPAV